MEVSTAHNDTTHNNRASVLTYLGLVWHYSSCEAAAFDSPIMQKEREGERERGRATSPLIKAKVEGNAVVHKRNGALASRTPIGRRTLCLSVIQEAEKELAAASLNMR